MTLVLGFRCLDDFNTSNSIFIFHPLLVFQCTVDGDCNGHGTCNTPLSVGKEIIMYKKHKRPAYFLNCPICAAEV